jgi:hypothetical protein
MLAVWGFWVARLIARLPKGVHRQELHETPHPAGPERVVSARRAAISELDSIAFVQRPPVDRVDVAGITHTSLGTSGERMTPQPSASFHTRTVPTASFCATDRSYRCRPVSLSLQTPTEEHSSLLLGCGWPRSRPSASILRRPADVYAECRLRVNDYRAVSRSAARSVMVISRRPVVMSPRLRRDPSARATASRDAEMRRGRPGYQSGASPRAERSRLSYPRSSCAQHAPQAQPRSVQARTGTHPSRTDQQQPKGVRPRRSRSASDRPRREPSTRPRSTPP